MRERRMMSLRAGSSVFLLIGMLAWTAGAEVLSLDAGGTQCRYDTATGRLMLALKEGELSLQAPVPLLEGHEAPVPHLCEVEVVKAEQRGAEIVADCVLSEGDISVSYQMTFKASGTSLLVHVQSESLLARGLIAPTLLTEGSWRRVDVSQYGVAHGQPRYQKATFDIGAKLWLWAFWRLDSGNASTWTQRCPNNHGSGPVELAPRAAYSPDTAGHCLPLDETIEIRAAVGLWDAVPPASNPPSAFRQQLAECIYLDLWGARPVEETQHLLDTLARLTGGRVKFYTILQNWQAGGFDALLPDSVRMPEFPPNPAVGSVEDLRALCAKGTEMGFFGFRTNYQLLRDSSPSFRNEEAHFALAADGSRKWHTKPTEIGALAERQEAEIQALFEPNATFTDQLASGGPPSAYLDYDAAIDGGTSMRATAARQRAFADILHKAHGGPLGSESLNAEYLFGRWVDTADFSVMDGHHRRMTPEYKLRRLHTLATTHGMGLPYRFYELPPFKKYHQGRSPWKDLALLDDYRCAEMLFGNAGYVFMPGTPWAYIATECLLVGLLQPHYLLQPVRDVRYWKDGEWRTLENLVRGGLVMNTLAYGPQTPEFARVRVDYANGLSLVVNRAEEALQVDAGGVALTLPQSGWVAWGQGVLAYSAYHPGTAHRVDFLEDETTGHRYLDPRGETLLGVGIPTLWERSGGECRIAVQVDPEEGRAWADGDWFTLERPRPAPLEELDVDFARGPGGWKPIAGFLRAEVTPDGWRLWVADPDPQLYSPPLNIETDSVERITLRFRMDEGPVDQALGGKFFFATEAAPGFREAQAISFRVEPNREWQTIALNPHDHPKWAGQTLTALRFDPIHGPAEAVLTLGHLRLEPREAK